MGEKALVLLSGGQDSTTSLVWAREVGNFDIEALSFYYGQRHKIEVEAAAKVTKEIGVSFERANLSFVVAVLAQLGGGEEHSSLLSEVLNISSPHPKDSSLPSSFVPGRNILFFLYGGIYAYWRGIHNIVSGVCQTDYSGYPDCRREFIDSMEQTLSRGLQFDIKIYTPLMFLSKAESIKLMDEMGYLWLLAYTHTCYNGERPPCGDCPACKLRIKGFEEAGIEDPLIKRIKN